MKPEKYWTIVYTRNNCERTITKSMNQKKIEHWWPLTEVRYYIGKKERIKRSNLFNRYLFVRASKMDLAVVKKINGVLTFVHWIDKPVIIPVQEVEVLRQFLSDHANVHLEKTNVNTTERVSVRHATHWSRDGSLVEMNSGSVKIHLPSLGYTVSTSGIPQNISDPMSKYQLQKNEKGLYHLKS